MDHRKLKIIVMLPMLLILLQLVASVVPVTSTSIIHQKPSTKFSVPMKARQMRRLKSNDDHWSIPKQTEYFDPKTYSSEDLPKFLEGFGQQIRQDLEKAHSWLIENDKKVGQLEAKVDQFEKLLEAQTANNASLSFSNFKNVGNFYAVLLALLVLLVACNLLLLKSLIVKKKSQKIIRLVDEIGTI